MGLYAEFLTVLDTKTYVVTLRRGGLGGGEGGEGGLLTEQKHIVFTALISGCESGLAQLTGWSWRPLKLT